MLVVNLTQANKVIIKIFGFESHRRPGAALKMGADQIGPGPAAFGSWHPNYLSISVSPSCRRPVAIVTRWRS